MTNIIANLIKNVICKIIGRSYVQPIGVFFDGIKFYLEEGKCYLS